MTASLHPASQIERLRVFAREFADAVAFEALARSCRNPFDSETFARRFWAVLVMLVVDDTVLPVELIDETKNDDLVIALYATEAAIDFLDFTTWTMTDAGEAVST